MSEEEIIGQLTRHIHSCAQLLRSGRGVYSGDAMRALLETLMQCHKQYPQRLGPGFAQALAQAMQQQQRGDFIGLADTLEYELRPQISADAA